MMIQCGVRRSIRTFVLCTVVSFFITVAEDKVSPLLHHQRTKREWEWKTLYAYEEEIPGQEPTIIGQLKNSHSGPNTEYKLMGEGANDIFVLKPTGEVCVLKTLDREKKSSYKLTAYILNKQTRLPLERETDFLVEVRDINDNTPQFLEPYSGSINERSQKESVVMKVRATDADDPKSPNGKLFFSLLNGTDLFRIIEKDGDIITIVDSLDREVQDEYKLHVRVSDISPKLEGHSNTTIITIKINDINDNTAGFTGSNFRFKVNENESMGYKIGQLTIKDPDEKENRKPLFSLPHPFSEMFEVELDDNKDGVLFLRQPLDYEKQNSYNFTVGVKEDDVVLRPDNPGPIVEATVLIKVQDVAEPPVFTQTEYNFNVTEGPLKHKTVIGSVSASDTDQTKYRIKYSIEESECPVEIHSETGLLTLTEELDRERQRSYTFHVIAQERAPDGQKSYATVKLEVLDINDNPPELVIRGDIYICENDRNGTIIGTIGASDVDENFDNFHFTLAKESSNFSLYDNLDNTASIIVTHGGFSSRMNVLEIEITDGGRPPKKNIAPLPLKLCKCESDRRSHYCYDYYKSGVSVSAILAILLCIITILVIVILFVLRKRYQKQALVGLGKSSGEIHEQLVSYDEEGGGEMDTNGYDVSVLSSMRYDTGFGLGTPPPAMYAVVNKPPACKDDMAVMIEVKKDEADHDRDGGPYDTLHIYGYEGSESLAGTLSSVDSTSSQDSELDYDTLNDWGPRFRTLAELYGYDEDASY